MPSRSRGTSISHRPDLGEHRLGPGAVAGVAAAAAGTVVLVVAEVFGDLRLQRGLQDVFLGLNLNPQEAVVRAIEARAASSNVLFHPLKPTGPCEGSSGDDDAMFTTRPNPVARCKVLYPVAVSASDGGYLASSMWWRVDGFRRYLQPRPQTAAGGESGTGLLVMTVATSASGAVCGTIRTSSELAVDGGPLHTFLGVPYAEPTAGRRFLPPIPVQPWAEVRDCARPGPMAPEGANRSVVVGCVGWGSCPDLNIWTPGIDGRPPSDGMDPRRRISGRLQQWRTA